MTVEPRFSVAIACLLHLLLAQTMMLATLSDASRTALMKCGISSTAISSTANFVNWHELFETESPIVYPTSNDEVIEIVNLARDNGCRVRPMGTTHSSDGIITQKAETNVIVMSLADYVPQEDWHMQLDEEAKRVRMSAGATQIEFIRFVRPLGYTCKTCTGTARFTLGGLFMNPSVHGAVFGEDRYPSLLTGALVVDGMGNLREIVGDDIKDWRGSLGLLGVVLAVEFEVKEDKGFEKVNSVYTFTGDDWNEEAITTAIRQEVAGKVALNLEWDYHSGRILFSTTRETGTIIDLQGAISRYDEVIASVPDLAKNGGPKSALVQKGSNLLLSLLGGSTLTDFVFDGKIDDDGPFEGFIEDGFESSVAVNNIQEFIPCSTDCIEDGQLFAILDASRNYFNAQGTYKFPGYFVLIRLIDVAREPMMTLENLLPGRYVSVDYSEIRFVDEVSQPFSSFLQGLQNAWDEVSNFTGSFHIGKEYGYGTLGDLPGVYPFQDDAIVNRIFNESTREAFKSAMTRYDPRGVFAGGAGLRLLGLSNVAFDARSTSVEESTFTSTSCDQYGNAECVSGCCKGGVLFFGGSRCTAVANLPQGSGCDIDCNCASGKCNKFLWLFGGSCA